MRVLVTGGAGFIGSHLCERLIKDGHSVKAIDNFSTGRAANLAQLEGVRDFTLVEGSILETETLTPLIAEADYVFHLAAAVGVFNIVNNPLASLLTNIRGTENVLEAAYATKTPVFLTSSSEVYGKNISNSLRESDDRILGSPVTLRWSYSEAKAIDESLAYAYFIEKQLETRIVRFFNTVGPRQLGAYGMVVPRFVKSAITNEPITIYGDGTQTRCFAHVYDVIDAVIAIAFAKNTIGKVINIGNNFEISINGLAQKIITETNSISEVVYVPYEETVGANSIPAESLDLAMSLGVLHHIPDTGVTIRSVASKIKSGGVLLCYLYYKLENKPLFYRGLFWTSNLLRWVISRLPYAIRRAIAQIIAGTIYLPLARTSKFLGSKGKVVSNFPLHHYADMPFVMLQNDALDRFGTRLEQRFSKKEITEMLGSAGFDLSSLKFSDLEPFWTFSVKKQ